VLAGGIGRRSRADHSSPVRQDQSAYFQPAAKGAASCG
jgi:hypothetical protein